MSNALQKMPVYIAPLKSKFNRLGDSIRQRYHELEIVSVRANIVASVICRDVVYFSAIFLLET
jgi:hypothetical protein